MLDMKIETFIAYQKKKKKSRDWHLPVGRPLYIVYHETKQLNAGVFSCLIIIDFDV